MRLRIFVLFVASVLSFAASAQFVAGQESLLEEPLDFKSALELARKGEARGFYQLAIKFSAGEGVARNRATGYKFLEKAADMGYANALYVLGRVKAAGLMDMGSLLFLDERTTAVPQTTSLAGAVFWDGEWKLQSVTDDAAFAVVSNCFARAAAGGIGAAEDDLKVLQQRRADALAEAAAASAAQCGADENLEAVRKAFPAFAVAEYPVPPSERPADPRPLSVRDPNAYFDTMQRFHRQTAQRQVQASRVDLWRLREARVKAEQAKKYANVRIDSICGISFGAPPPTWLKQRGWSSSDDGPKTGFASGKLQKPFRYFTACDVELAGTGVVRRISLSGDLHPSMSDEDQKKEFDAVLDALEKKYAFKFPRREEGTGGYPSWFGEIGRYNVNLGVGKVNDMPYIHLSIADRDVTRQTAVPAGIKLKLPANAGLDVL